MVNLAISSLITGRSLYGAVKLSVSPKSLHKKIRLSPRKLHRRKRVHVSARPMSSKDAFKRLSANSLHKKVIIVYYIYNAYRRIL